MDDIEQVNLPTDLDGIDSLCEKVDRKEFVDMLKAMLCMDQDRRLSPTSGLQHKFVRMSHLMEMGRTKYFTTASQRMDVCNRNDRLYPVTPRVPAAPVAAVASQQAPALIPNTVQAIAAPTANSLAQAMPLQPDFSNFFNQYSAAIATQHVNPAVAPYIYQPALAAVLPYGKNYFESSL